MQSRNPFSCFIIGVGTLPIRCAEVLLHHGLKINGIISSDVVIKRWAKERDTPNIDPRDDVIAFVKRQPCDYLFSIVNSYILPKEILDLPRRYAINYHNALLPKYAGSNVTSWAITARETVHGVTWHVMSELVDAGDILKQCPVDITDNDSALTLNAKCYEAAIVAFAELIDDLVHGRALRKRQNLDERTFFSRYKRPPIGCVFSWNRSAYDIDAFVRALDFAPYLNPLGLPKFAIGSDFIIARKVEVLDVVSQTPPGTVTGIDNESLRVSTTDREIALRRLLTITGQPLSIPDLAMKLGLHEGYRFRNIDPEKATRLTELNASICRHEDFWVERLSTLQPLALPYAARNVPPATLARYASMPVPLPEEVISYLANRQPTWNLSDFLLTAFAVYLTRTGGVDRFDIKYRDAELRRDLAGLEGFFTSQVPLRLEIDNAQGFAAAIRSVREQVELTKRRKTYARDAVTRYPALRSIAELQRGHWLPLAVERVQRLENYEATLGSDLTLVVPEDGTQCHWVYDAAVFDKANITRMLCQFTILLRAIIADPDQRIADFPLLTEKERRQLLVEWNDTKSDYPKDKCIHELFERQVERSPDAVAVVFENQELTYRDLNRRANQLANYLQKLGVGPEIPVGICIERSQEMVVGLLGILKAGGAYVPLTPSYPKERLAFMLEDAQVPVLLTQQRLIEGLSKHRAKVVSLDTDWEVIAQESEANPVSYALPENLAYVIYTSGSTGKPKGVEIQHAGLVNLVTWHQRVYSVTPADRATQLASPAFDASVWELWPYMTAGARIDIPNEEIVAFPSKLLAWLAAKAITICFLPTPLAEAVLEEPWPEFLALRVLLTGGDKLRRRSRNALPFCLANNYGPTENTVVTTWTPLATDTESQVPPPIGRPIANIQVYLLDSGLQPVPMGVAGEIYIGGVGLARGYLKHSDLTAEKFIPHPFSAEPGARLYKTGDLARYLPDCNIEFLGRVDYQVKIRGFRIELGEIESRLSQHPSVREAVVVAREDVLGDRRLVAYIVSNQQPVPSHDNLRNFLKQKLPEYMLPSAFVPLESLPLTPNGKVDRRALPTPDQARPELMVTFVAPRTPLEELLAGIWVAVLKVEKVGVHDNFFELGGHSLLTTQVISRVHDTFGLNLPVRSLFENPTIEGLANMIQTGKAGGSNNPVTALTPLSRHLYSVKQS